MTIARDGLGLELAQPAHLGCLEVSELAVSLPNLRFPLDVSGGLARFRHRRGVLERMVMELGARDLERWAAPRLRGVLGPRPPEVWVAVRRAGATVGLVDRDADRPPEGTELASPRVLAFEVALDAEDDAVGVTVWQARGSGLPAPAATLAIAAVQALLGKRASREGSRFLVRNAARAAARVLLPEAGVRAPGSDDLRWSALGAHEDRWLLIAQRGAAPAEATEEATRAREASALAREGDDARVEGDHDRARELDAAALERAARHPELARRIAEIDQLAGGRAEAALATLQEADRRGGHEGLLEGELLAEIADTRAAVASFVRVGETEPVPALAARAFERAADLTTDPLDALVWLDLAVARAPRTAHLRWSRLARRLAAGRLEDALADAEYLEALASGARARHAVWRHAGHLWRKAGLVAEAALVFERALRFRPDDPRATAGLGSALVASGRAARGADLLSHALEEAEARGEPWAGIALELARALAERLEDRPAAVARARSVPTDAAEAPEARRLEGRWRAELGDLAGASLAFARMRDLVATHVTPAREPDARTHVDWLVEAATFEADQQNDLPAAQRHLAVALRLAPRDAAVLRAYRDLGRRGTGRDVEERHAETEPPEALPPAGLPLVDLGGADEPADEAQAVDAARVEELTRALHANPDNDSVVDELAERLARLGRTHELLALLSARLEDASAERRVALVPKQRAVLERLEQSARAAGNAVEADLFRDARQALED